MKLVTVLQAGTATRSATTGSDADTSFGEWRAKEPTKICQNVVHRNPHGSFTCKKFRLFFRGLSFCADNAAENYRLHYFPSRWRCKTPLGLHPRFQDQAMSTVIIMSTINSAVWYIFLNGNVRTVGVLIVTKCGGAQMCWGTVQICSLHDGPPDPIHRVDSDSQ